MSYWKYSNTEERLNTFLTKADDAYQFYRDQEIEYQKSVKQYSQVLKKIPKVKIFPFPVSRPLFIRLRIKLRNPVGLRHLLRENKRHPSAGRGHNRLHAFQFQKGETGLFTTLQQLEDPLSEHRETVRRGEVEGEAGGGQEVGDGIDGWVYGGGSGVVWRVGCVYCGGDVIDFQFGAGTAFLPGNQ